LLKDKFVLIRLNIKIAQNPTHGKKWEIGRGRKPCRPKVETVDAGYEEEVQREESEDEEVGFAG
jgi:hypothetical protein